LERDRPQEAIAVAASFDHPAPAMFLPVLPASLTLRREASLALGQRGWASTFEKRLARLGRRDPLARRSTKEPP
jgi:hypothetical protein